MANGVQHRSELVSVVAWMLIVAGAFSLFVGLFQLAFFGAVWAYTPNPQPVVDQLGPYLWVVAFFLVMAVLMLVAGIGLRRRYNWARVLSMLLCYGGIFVVVVLFGLYYFGINQLLAGQRHPDQAQLWGTVGMVLKTFLGSFTVAVTALLAWIANRLGAAPVLAEFKPPVIAAVAPAALQKEEPPRL